MHDLLQSHVDPPVLGPKDKSICNLQISSDDDDDEAVNLHGVLQAGARKFVKQLLQQQASGNIKISSIEGDALPPDAKLNPISSDYMITCEDDFDNIVGAVSAFISGKPRDLKLCRCKRESIVRARQAACIC